MTASIADLRKTIASAQDLHSVVRTMKALAASNISQYEQAVLALDEYYRTVQLGLGLCVRAAGPTAPSRPRTNAPIGIVVFGSDQGLVGRFNDVVADHATTLLGAKDGARVWAVGERVAERLVDTGLGVAGLLAVPLSVDGIIPLVDDILRAYEREFGRGDLAELHLVYNKPMSGSVYQPVKDRLLPLDDQWRHEMHHVRWPTRSLPQVVGDTATTLAGFIREFLFVSLFRACASSLASENASRLAAMQRADKNIDTLLEEFGTRFHRLRQQGIDEELFDVVAGYEALLA